MRTALFAAALLALSACGPAEPPAEPPAPPSPARLTLVDGSGAPALTLSCPAGPGVLLIHAPGLEPIGSEERLTLGAGDEAFTFVADLQAPGPGVTGGGGAEADLFARMARGEPVRAVYGAQSIGPVQADTPAALGDFIARCGAPAGR